MMSSHMDNYDVSISWFVVVVVVVVVVDYFSVCRYCCRNRLTRPMLLVLNQ